MLTSVFGISIKYEAWNQQDCSCNSCGYVGSVFDQRNIAL